MSNLKLVFVLGAVALSGCGTSPSASGVFPADGFTGRTLRVEISGDATDWKDGATVNFGDGVTVSSVAVASPTDMFAEIAIDGAAAPGLRDVTVSSDGSFTLKQAFELKSPIDVTFVGNIDQGGFPAYTITSHDFDNPFDGTTDAMGALVNFSIMGPPGTTFTSPNVSAYSVTGFMSIDIDATPGPITISSGPAGAVIDSVGPSVAIGTRSATPLTSGAATVGMLPKENDSALYSLAASGTPSLVHLSLSSTDQNAFPVSAILDSTGHWANQIGGDFAVLPSAGTVYVVVFDGGSEANYSFTVNATGEMLTSAAEGDDVADNTKASSPNNAMSTLPYRMTGSISAVGDTDYVRFTVDALHANKSLHVSTGTGADRATDTQVDVVTVVGTTSFTPQPGGGPIDQSDCSFFGCSDFGETFVTNPLPQGNYAIAVSDGPNFSAMHKNYTLLFWFD